MSLRSGKKPGRTVSQALAANIRNARNELNLTQDDLAEQMVRTGFNWSRATVAQSEGLLRPPPDQGRVRKITIEELIGLAWVLKRSVFELLDTDGFVDVTERLGMSGNDYATVLYRPPDQRDVRLEELQREIARQRKWKRDISEMDEAADVLLEELENRLAELQSEEDR
jgi:transcriptional regulator with XRE-family HTH domain